MNNPVINNILNRKSVRNFTDEKVSKEDLEVIVKTAMAAPSAMNLQPWRYILFDKQDILEFMVDVHEYSKMFKTAKAGILVCGDMDDTVKLKDFWIQDCSASVENMLLAIESLGLGGVWLGIYPIEERCKKLSKYFNLPENIVPFALVAIGHPAGDTQPKNKYDLEKIHWNKW